MPILNQLSMPHSRRRSLFQIVRVLGAVLFVLLSAACIPPRPDPIRSHKVSIKLRESAQLTTANPNPPLAQSVVGVYGRITRVLGRSIVVTADSISRASRGGTIATHASPAREFVIPFENVAELSAVDSEGKTVIVVVAIAGLIALIILFLAVTGSGTHT